MRLFKLISWRLLSWYNTEFLLLNYKKCVAAGWEIRSWELKVYGLGVNLKIVIAEMCIPEACV